MKIFLRAALAAAGPGAGKAGNLDGPVKNSAARSQLSRRTPAEPAGAGHFRLPAGAAADDPHLRQQPAAGRRGVYPA